MECRASRNAWRCSRSGACCGVSRTISNGAGPAPGGAERIPSYPEWMMPSTAWKPSMRAASLRGSALWAAASAGLKRCLFSVVLPAKPYTPSLVSSECREMMP